jgi:hypothetical protein
MAKVTLQNFNPILDYYVMFLNLKLSEVAKSIGFMEALTPENIQNQVGYQNYLL